jgi:ABC transport system ATP-binding/permease protein
MTGETIAPVADAQPKKKLSFKENTEYDQLEKEIAELEAEKERLSALLEKGSDDRAEIMKWSESISHIMAQLDEKSMRWLELSELM